MLTDFPNSFTICSKTCNEVIITDSNSNASLHYPVKRKCHETSNNLKEILVRNKIKLNENVFD